MNVPRDNSELPDPLGINDTGAREYWIITVKPGEERRVLRPGWADSWTANELGWAKEAAECVQKDGARWNPSIKQEELAELARPTILAAIHVTFSSWVKAYRKSQKSMVDQFAVRQKQRRNGRKAMVNESLIAAKELFAHQRICRKLIFA